MGDQDARRAAAMAAVKSFSSEGRPLHHGSWAAYGPGEIRIAAPEDTEVIVPLPAGADVSAVTAVHHDGSEAPHRWSPDPHGYLLFVPDCGGPIAYLRLRWSAAGSSARH